MCGYSKILHPPHFNMYHLLFPDVLLPRIGIHGHGIIATTNLTHFPSSENNSQKYKFSLAALQGCDSSVARDMPLQPW